MILSILSQYLALIVVREAVNFDYDISNNTLQQSRDATEQLGCKSGYLRLDKIDLL